MIGQCVLRHRAAEFIRFLRLIDKQIPAEFDLHLILDSHAAHKTEAVKRWLARCARFYVHFTPTSASWINAVEGLFAALTKPRLKPGVYRSVIETNQAIRNHLDDHNQHPKPFRWTAAANTIIAKHQRGERLLESVHLVHAALRGTPCRPGTLAAFRSLLRPAHRRRSDHVQLPITETDRRGEYLLDGPARINNKLVTSARPEVRPTRVDGPVLALRRSP